MKRGLLLILFLIPILTFAQSKVFGTLQNDVGSIPYANILLENTEGKITSHTTSDDNGYFELTSENGKFILKISFVGYKTIERNINISGNKDLGKIQLEEESESLGQVEISAYKKVIKREKGKIIFDVKNSPFKSGYETTEILRITPQVLVDIDGSVKLPNGTPIVYVNGVELRLSGDDLTNYLNNLDSKNIERIEVKTTGSAKNSATNNNGSINIVLKEFPVGYHTSFTGRISYRDKDHIDRYIGNSSYFGAKKWNAYITADYFENFDQTKTETTNTFKNSNDTFNGKSIHKLNNYFSRVRAGIVLYPISSFTFGLEGFYRNSSPHSVEIGSQIYNQNEDVLRYTSVSDAKETTELYYGLTNITYNYDDKGSKIHFAGQIGNNKFISDNNVTLETFDPINYTEIDIFDTDAKSNYYDIKLDWNKIFEKDWEVSAGGRLSNVERENKLNIFTEIEGESFELDGEDFENRESIYAAYISLTKEYKKHFFEVGLRSETTNLEGIDKLYDTSVDRNYTDLFPTFNYNYNISDHKNLSLSFDKSIQRASFRQLNPYIIKINEKLYLTGNPNLTPTYLYSVGADYAYKSHTFSVRAKRIEDMISQLSIEREDGILETRPMNIGESQIYTISHDFSKRFKSKFFLKIYSKFFYTHFKYNEKIYETPSFTNQIVFYYFLNKKWTLFLTNKFVTDYRNELAEESSWDRLSVGFKLKVLKGKGIINFAAYDILNTLRMKSNTDFNTFTQDYYSKNISRFFSLSFKYTLSGKKKIQKKNLKDDGNLKNRI
ncbi:outer membrane beta-barrel protein [Aureivirga sp. CE67]|uniref:outer membrane beta-barrel protein n=1 Tax=Aureivirga sp. CE67 TaxID=1788983 RepID=UPI0018C965D7|nr:outer membrane beta-barrel family protein [Aureivirga sp. CE67]